MKVLQPHQMVASKVGGNLGKLIAPEAAIAAKSKNPLIKAANPTNLLQDSDGASANLMGGK